MNAKHVAWWLAGVLAVLIVIAAGAWSLGVATAFAYADEPAATTTAATAPKTDAASATVSSVAKPATVATTPSASSATASTVVKKLTATDPLPGSEKLPLVKTATPVDKATEPTPATFTISGMKYLKGRALKAGEFSFALIPAGVYAVPMGSSLTAQLREGSSLTAAEKYELVAHGGLQYSSSATQPVPAASVVSNAADGQVTFSTLTFDAASLGKYATRRYAGSIFCYTIVEQAPRAATEKNAEGQYVYQGMTYDNSVKRVYLYAYETGDDSTQCHIEVVPLGDASFSTKADDPVTGQGDGFLNVYTATSSEPADGAASDSSGGAADGAAPDMKPSDTPTGGTASAGKPSDGAVSGGAASGGAVSGGAAPDEAAPDGVAPDDTPVDGDVSGDTGFDKPSTDKPSTEQPSGSASGTPAKPGVATSSDPATGSASAAGSSTSTAAGSSASASGDFQTVVTEGPATMPETEVSSSTTPQAAPAPQPTAESSVVAVVTSDYSASDGPMHLFPQAPDQWAIFWLIVVAVVALGVLGGVYLHQKKHEE